MAGRKIVWSNKAKEQLFRILEYYTYRNKSKTYSVKLYNRIVEEIKLLDKHPDLGIRTEVKSVRGLIVETYIIFYEITKDRVLIHTLWDCRQNPDTKTLKENR